MRIGLISDTHGLLRPEAVAALQRVDLIVHAGDVGGLKVVEKLRRVAPVHAVAGNVDAAGSYPPAVDLVLAGVRLHVSHGHEVGSPTPERLAALTAADVIVYGHTHRALIRRVGNTLVVNPGAAGPARFRLTPSVALLDLPSCEATIVHL
jgi:putative phosphoesterase